MVKLKAFLFRRDGTITLFAALSMSFLIIFFMVLIDISRLFLFAKLTESSTKLASRSVISAYDLRLYEKYGLFGRGGTDGTLIARQVFTSNISTELNFLDMTTPITLVPIELEEVEVLYDHFLGEHDELEQQIVEEMKYKAPIDFTLELVESFTGLKKAGHTAKELVDSLELLQDLFEKREQAIEELYELQQLAAHVDRAYPLDQQFASIAGGYSSYIGYLQEEQSISEEVNKLKLKQEKLTKEEKKVLEQLTKQQQSVQRTINEYLAHTNQALQKSEQHQQRQQNDLQSLANAMEEKLNLARTLNNTISIQYDMLLLKQQSSEPATSPTSSSLDQLQMEFSREGLIRPVQFFDQYESEINELLNTYQSFQTRATGFTQVTRQALHQPALNQSSSAPMENSLTAFTQEKTVLYSNYISPATILMKRKQAINELDSVKEQVKENEEQYKQLVGHKHYLSHLSTIYDQLQKDQASFDTVQQYYKRNLERNREMELGQAHQEELTSDGNKNAKHSLNQFTQLLNSMDSIGSKLQAHLYRNEYIIQRFLHLPLGQLEHMATVQRDNINFHNQAVEYIMLGFSEPSANITFVMAQIFAIRLAIRTIEGFIANKHLANPIIILSSAILYGLEHAIKDMDKLLEDGKTELSKYIKLDISYSLYLRLLLSIHGIAREQTLSRIAAVVEHDLQLDLMQTATSSIVMTKTKTKLWMLPTLSGLASRIAADSILVEKGYYEKLDYASSSY